MLELYHHGIKGQRWGVRRFQNEDGSLTPAGYEHYYGESAKQKKEYLKTRDRINSGKATPEDLAKLSGNTYINDLDSSIVSVGYKFSNNSMSALGTTKLKELDEANKIFTDQEGNQRVTAVQALRKSQPLNLDDDLIMKSVTRRINPGYSSNDNGEYTGILGGQNNCVRCATAMTLAKMGYSTPNGLSAGLSLNGADHHGFSYWFDGAKAIEGTKDEISDELSKQPKGSFGEFNISRYDAYGNRIGGHAMTYSILQDGSVRIEDAQCGKTFKTIEDAMANCGASSKGMSFTRLDNTKPNFDAIEKDNMIDVGRTKSNNSYITQKMTNVNSIFTETQKFVNGDETAKKRAALGFNTPQARAAFVYGGTNRISSYDWKRDNTNFMSYNDAIRDIKESVKDIPSPSKYPNSQIILDQFNNYLLKRDIL